MHLTYPFHRLVRMLVCLTILFILAQLVFFTIHYHVSELIDSLINSSLSHVIFSPVIFLPILQYIAIQILAYCLLICWVVFIAGSLSQLFRLPTNAIYWLGINYWILNIIIMFVLNSHYFPGSFFAQPFHQDVWLSKFENFILLLTLSILLITTLLAYVNYFWFKRFPILGGIFLVFGLVMLTMALPNQDLPIEPHKNYHQPNIIIIGLDSVRPDFVRYFKNNNMHTPTIDNFLQSAITFTQAYTPLARTFPAWISLLSAKHPVHSGARNNLIASSELTKEDNLAKRLQQSGYETMYATDEKRFSNITNEYGFDHIIGPRMGVNDFLLGGLTDFPMSNLLLKLPIARFLFPYQFGNRAASITYDPNDFLQLVYVALAQRADKPLFLAIHLCLSHWPFTWARDGQEENFTLPQRYRSSVEAVDYQLSKLLQILKEQKLLEHSLVILLSDHGTTLGLVGDRTISKNKYVGDQLNLKKIALAKLSSASQYSLDFKHDYTIAASYGQATDVLSLKQYHILLGMKGFGIPLTPRLVNNFVSSMDIAPTILDYLKVSPLKQIDGISLATTFSISNQIRLPERSFFFETGDKLSEIEINDIHIEKVLQKQIGIYRVHSQNGLLFINPADEKYILQAKQYAILQGEWLLAYYPASIETRLIASNSSILLPNLVVQKPYYVLVNLKSGQWTIGLSSVWAKSAPIAQLTQQLQSFYGDKMKFLD